MITNRSDLLEYLEADRIALKRRRPTIKSRIRSFFLPDYIWKFQRLLRKVECLNNRKKKTVINRICFYYRYYQFKRLSIRLGFSIPLNVFGPGLAIVHIGTIVVNPRAKVGANCRIHVCTNIGSSAGSPMAPVIGDNVYIAPGVKIYGDITIANNIAIAANAAVNKSFNEEHKVIGGVPARVIGDIDITSIIKHLSF